MAGIISISSDEEELNSTENPKKKLKREDFICLDLEDEGKVIKPDDKEIEDIIIESDEDLSSFDKDILSVNTEDCVNGKSQSKRDIDSKHTKGVIAEPDKNEVSNNSITKSITKHVLNYDVEDIVSDEDMTLLTNDCAPKETTSGNKSTNKKLEDKSEKDDVASTSKQGIDTFWNCKKMQLFIDLCLSQIENEETKTLFKSKIPFCKKLFDKVDNEYIQSENFTAYLEEKITQSKKSSLKAVSSFNDVYYHLKYKLRKQKGDTEITSKHDVVISKLERALRKVHRKIAQLEEEEVNFDEEEDSSYLKMHRYRERAVKLHEKICKYKNEDSKANNILYNRLDFSGSKYPEFNHAINKKFKNNMTFPTYYEVERCLKKVSQDKNMDISDNKFKQEARECFKNLGNLLQKRRKLDLLNIHSQYLTTSDDPAHQNEELNSKLLTNSKEAKSKIDEICEKYVKLQEKGEDPNLSSDSDDSKQASTEDEDDA